MGDMNYTIKEADLDRLSELEQSASSAPWHLSEVSDRLGMSTVAVTKNAATGREIGELPEWEPVDVVAACLLQSDAPVGVDDRRWRENAKLIADMRNALPELLTLARVGLKSLG